MSSISSLGSYSTTDYAKSLFSKMDTDGSGGVSKEEFTAARPSDVSETQAAALFDSLDSSGSGSLSESDIDSMESNKKGTGSVSLDDSTLQALLQSLSGLLGGSGSSSSAASSASSGASSGDGSLADMISAMDTNGDGTVTKDEFLSARPDDVSETMAENLWSQFDTEGAGSLSTSDLQTAMEANAPPPPPPGGGGMGPMASSSDEDDDDTAISAMDTNGDGYVSEAEFLAARPSDVSETMAESLWSQFDTEGAGSLSTSDLKTAMEANAPSNAQTAEASKPTATLLDELSGDTSGGSVSSTATSLTASALQALLKAVQSYESSSGYGMTQNTFASILATA